MFATLNISIMTYTKSHRFDEDLQHLAKYAKAISHPARLAILRYLASSQTCISGDISNEIPLSRTTVSQHLQELKSLGLIKGEINGVKVNYCISSDQIKEMIEKFETLFIEISRNEPQKTGDCIC
jgi:ArsR family transcriptional regulator, arsenate/arsenite/antimonite-responsive transcriptional repressor